MRIYIDCIFVLYKYNVRHIFRSEATWARDQSCFAGIVENSRLTKRRRNVLKRLRTFSVNLLTHVLHIWYTCGWSLWITAELTHRCVTLDGCHFSIDFAIFVDGASWCVFDLVCRFSVSSCLQARERERADREAMERPGDMFLILENVKAQSLRHTFFILFPWKHVCIFMTYVCIGYIPDRFF